MQNLGNKVLEILADNARNNASPQLVDSDLLASQLHISLRETRQVLNCLHHSGLVIASIECQFSMITLEGLRRVAQLAPVSPCLA